MGRGEPRPPAAAGEGRALTRVVGLVALGCALAVSTGSTACGRPADRRTSLPDTIVAAATGRTVDARSNVPVRVHAESAVTLAGTLTLPDRGGRRRGAASERVAAVLLVGGSGPQDRDGARPELPGYAPWRDVSDALATAGLAVLRLDDRGTGESTGRFAGATTEDFAHDAAAAVAWLRRQAMIDPARIAIVGHSEGAVVALLVARADPALRALVLLGAPSRPGREIARWQRDHLVRSDLARWPASERGAVLAAAEAEAEALATRDPWLREWFTLDPRTVASGIRQPVLLLHGETDQQVPPAHADELAAVLRRGGARVVQVQRVPDTDHLLLPDHDGDPQGYVRLAERRVRTGIITATTHFLSVHTARD